MKAMERLAVPRPFEGTSDMTCELIHGHTLASVRLGQDESRPCFGLVEPRDEANGRYPALRKIEMIGVAHQRAIAGEPLHARARAAPAHKPLQLVEAAGQACEVR